MLFNTLKTLLCTTALIGSAASWATPQTFFETSGPYGEGHYGTEDYDIESVQPYGAGADFGRSTMAFRVTLNGLHAFPLYNLVISTLRLGQPLTVGTYTDAQRFAFSEPGHPGLDFSAFGQGFNTLTGGFTVYDATLGANGKIERFAASFYIGEPNAVIQQGRIWYNSEVSPAVPEPTSVLLVAAGLGCVQVLRRTAKRR